MFSGKNIGYIALLAIAGVLIYYFFFRKKEGAKVENPENKPEEKSGRNVGVKNATEGMVIHLAPTPEVSTPSDQSYVGPQDCAENCNLPYHTRLLYCYYRMNGDSECLAKAERLKQECLGKCSEAIPRYKNLEEVATPLQEDNYFSNLFRQGYV